MSSFSHFFGNNKFEFLKYSRAGTRPRKESFLLFEENPFRIFQMFDLRSRFRKCGYLLQLIMNANLVKNRDVKYKSMFDVPHKNEGEPLK